MSNFICEFSGASSHNADTLKSFRPLVNVLSMGFSLPKYFLAIYFVITILSGASKAVVAFPSINLKEIF
jgi:hypothetical protein